MMATGTARVEVRVLGPRPCSVLGAAASRVPWQLAEAFRAGVASERLPAKQLAEQLRRQGHAVKVTSREAVDGRPWHSVYVLAEWCPSLLQDAAARLAMRR
jgi:hypothetical protein